MGVVGRGQTLIPAQQKRLSFPSPTASRGEGENDLEKSIPWHKLTQNRALQAAPLQKAPHKICMAVLSALAAMPRQPAQSAQDSLPG